MDKIYWLIYTMQRFVNVKIFTDAKKLALAANTDTIFDGPYGIWNVKNSSLCVIFTEISVLYTSSDVASECTSDDG